MRSGAVVVSDERLAVSDRDGWIRFFVRLGSEWHGDSERGAVRVVDFGTSRGHGKAFADFSLSPGDVDGRGIVLVEGPRLVALVPRERTVEPWRAAPLGTPAAAGACSREVIELDDEEDEEDSNLGVPRFEVTPVTL